MSVPSAPEHCAWYGERIGSELVFGIADFWPAYWGSGGKPEADLSSRAPRWVGRFDLARRRFREPIEAGKPQMASGTWDVLPLADPGGPPGAPGRIAFTSLFEASGVVVDASSASGERGGSLWSSTGMRAGLSELAEGPEGVFLASRYLPVGSVVAFDLQSLEPLAEFPLPLPPQSDGGGYFAAKTVAFDRASNAAWVTTDRLDAEGRMWDPGTKGEGPSAAAGKAHPTLVISLESGRLLTTIDDRELQFVRFDRSGRGVAVSNENGKLIAIEIAADSAGGAFARLEAGRRTLLEERYASGLDFAQDVSFGDRGEIVVTRWSGAIHILAPSAPDPLAPLEQRRIDLPRYEANGLYYSAFVFGDHVCATYCADVSVVCAPLR